MPHLSFPNESAEYRTARNALLDAEIALRRQLEAVAAQRRALPPGGAVPEDFVFERIGAHQRPELVKLSELFGEYPSILLYSFMYGPERDEPCPGCTHTLDGLPCGGAHDSCDDTHGAPVASIRPTRPSMNLVFHSFC